MISLLFYHTFYIHFKVVCTRKLRMGNIGDGGWEICDDPAVRPRPGPGCIVYSFGINYDFSFDDHVAQIYGCHVYSFDPSMKDETHNRLIIHYLYISHLLKVIFVVVFLLHIYSVIHL